MIKEKSPRPVITTTTTIARYHHHHRHLSHPQSLVTITTIVISPIPNRSSPPPSLLRSVFTTVTLVITTTVHFSVSHSMSLVEHTGPRGMTLPKLCPSVCKVVVMTREQELMLCRGDVSNSCPSRLTRMLQSLTGIAKCSL
ncbi:hypothetical protein YC2023_082108 [Brassica napus]|uniref:Uncharacterized protein n=1 Tax=Brassica oleracea var. oleracea TaxID=109376 RepID=A0A0D3D425_BRAOL|nr:PREDICTED: uncharacterized protein LOC106304739 [Brassica oleracea var. oleracea]XP_013596587.1 PREDICTED: uncharacterized protein LOC106304739 [Brassica oleracea var. oleracea]